MIDTVFYILKSTIVMLIDVLLFAMFVRAILSWFDPMHEWRLSGFLTMITEPVILPIRILCDKPTPINLDGELRVAQTVEMTVAAEKIRFFYPRELSWKVKEPAGV